MTPHHPLAHALIVVLGLGLALPATQAAAAPGLQVYDRATIERSGAFTLAEFLRTLPAASHGIGIPGLSWVQRFPRFETRGLGAQRVEVLVDGHLAPASAASGANLAAIPLALVERIEYDPAGALPARGGGAGGTLNVVLRRSEEGGMLALGAANPQHRGGDQAQLAALYGLRGERGSFSIGLARERTDAVQGGDRPWSQRPADSLRSNNFRSAVGAAGIGYSQGTLLAHPVHGAAVPGGCNGPGFSLGGSGSGTRCSYDFNHQASYQLELESQALATHAQWAPGGAWQADLDVYASRARALGHLAPPPDSSQFPLLIPTGSPNHPAVRLPGSGYDASRPVFLHHRFVGLGRRQQGATEDGVDVRLGLSGRAAGAAWEVSLFHGETELDGRHVNEVDFARAQGAIASGRYDIYDPSANPAAVIDELRLRRHSGARAGQYGLEAVAHGAFDGPEGARWQLHAQYLRESLRVFDSLDPQPVFSDGARRNAAFGAGLEAPLAEGIRGRASLRYDDAGSYGGEASVQLGLDIDLLAGGWLRVDATRGFVAPALGIDTRRSREVGPGLVFVGDLPRCPDFGLPDDDCAVLFQAYDIDNPNLEAETRTARRIELGWGSPDDWQVSLAGFHERIDDAVRWISPSEILYCLLGRYRGCPDDLVWLPVGATPDPALGLGFALDPSLEAPMYAQAGYANHGRLDVRGVELSAAFRRDLDGRGTLGGRLRFNRVTHLTESYLDFVATDLGARRSLAGGPLRPRDRAWVDLWWRRDAWQLSWQLRYTGDQQSVAGQRGIPGFDPQVPDWVVHDLQLRWEAPWRGEIALGVRNAFDRVPPIDALTDFSADVALALYESGGRTPYLQYRQRW